MGRSKAVITNGWHNSVRLEKSLGLRGETEVAEYYSSAGPCVLPKIDEIWESMDGALTALEIWGKFPVVGNWGYTDVVFCLDWLGIAFCFHEIDRLVKLAFMIKIEIWMRPYE